MRRKIHESTSFTGSLGLIDVLANALGSIVFFLMVFMIISAQVTISSVVLPHVLPDAVCNTDYSVELAVSGGHETHEWEVVDGVLPAGLFLTGSGVIKGVPREGGKFDFMAKATDAKGSSAVRDLTLNVLQKAAATTPLRIVTDVLPGALRGHTYRATLAAVGGVGQYNWTVQSGDDLPPGLTLEDGRINGTATSTGTWQFEIAVEDEQPEQETQALSLTVLIPE